MWLYVVVNHPITLRLDPVSVNAKLAQFGAQLEMLTGARLQLAQISSEPLMWTVLDANDRQHVPTERPSRRAWRE